MMTVTDPCTPFWRSGRLHRESLLFIEPAPGQSATCSLLLPPSGPVSLESAAGDTAYLENVNYILDTASGLLTRAGITHPEDDGR